MQIITHKTYNNALYTLQHTFSRFLSEDEEV